MIVAALFVVVHCSRVTVDEKLAEEKTEVVNLINDVKACAEQTTQVCNSIAAAQDDTAAVGAVTHLATK